MASGTASSSPGTPSVGPRDLPLSQASGSRPPEPVSPADPILCGHCGRSASNGISCQGICVADSGY